MKYNLKSTIALSLTTIIFSSCGKKQIQLKASNVVSKVNFSENAIIYPSIHEYCALVYNTRFDRISNLFSFLDGKLTKSDQVKLANTFDGFPMLKSSDNKIVSSTYSNTHILERITFIVNEEKQIIDGSVSAESEIGKRLVYCSNQALKRESAQHVALNITSTLDKTYSTLQIAGLTKEITPVTVFAHPKYESEYNYVDEKTKQLIFKQSRVMTDNAFYFNSGLYFIPHSKEFKNYLGSKHVNYWEIPFVTSHEYGHHLFATFFPKSQVVESLKSVASRTCFHGHNIQKSNNVENNTNVQERVVTVDDVLVSFNEGFADLIAFYTLDSAHSSLDNVFGFDDEREVNSLWFGNFSTKELGETEGSYFFKSTAAQQNDLNAKFQDGHAIGAIFAAQFEHFMALQKLGSIQKLTITIEWVKLMEKNFDKNKSLPPFEYMKAGIDDFLTVYLELTGFTDLSTEQSKAILSGFSYLY